MDPKIVKIRKVNLETIIDLLYSMWDSGVDYVDIVGELTPNQDSVLFSFSREYMAEEYVGDFDKWGTPDEEGNNKVSISDEDLNDIS